MHNCRLTRNGLIDLALDETPSAEAKQLLAELNDCAACREEYATLRNTWRVSGQALQSKLPAESFWPGYHTRLEAKLIQHFHENDQTSSSAHPVQLSMDSPSWRRGWIVLVMQTVSLRTMVWRLATTSVRIPVPIALVLMLLCGVSVLALRASGPVATVVETPASPVALVETRTVQVPLIQEKVVTRVVYVEKRSSRSRTKTNQLDRDSLNASNRPGRAVPGVSAKTAMSLVGFKPTDQVKLTIIKGSYQDEK